MQEGTQPMELWGSDGRHHLDTFSTSHTRSWFISPLLKNAELFDFWFVSSFLGSSVLVIFFLFSFVFPRGKHSPFGSRHVNLHAQQQAQICVHKGSVLSLHPNGAYSIWENDEIICGTRTWHWGFHGPSESQMQKVTKPAFLQTRQWMNIHCPSGIISKEQCCKRWVQKMCFYAWSGVTPNCSEMQRPNLPQYLIPEFTLCSSLTHRTHTSIRDSPPFSSTMFSVYIVHSFRDVIIALFLSFDTHSSDYLLPISCHYLSSFPISCSLQWWFQVAKGWWDFLIHKV